MARRSFNSNNSASTKTQSMVQSLLSEIYTNYHLQKQFDSSTEASCLSDGTYVSSCGTNLPADISSEKNKKAQASLLETSDVSELKIMKEELEERVVVMSAKLVRQLKQRNRLQDRHLKHCDTITAVLQAVSPKRREDAKLRFNLSPSPGLDGFNQWCDALRAIVQLPGGLPACWRKRIWLAVADHYFKTKYPKKDWEEVKGKVFSDRVCSTDETLGNQIVKDLHRTGGSGFTNSSSQDAKAKDRLLLKRVLLAYARWNQDVGYCQGFNVLADLLLQVTEGNDESALKIMIYLIDFILPKNYFANNLQALSVDMAVFRDLLKVRLPTLSRHLDALQKAANENLVGSNYEPPLTNVFTMQWFLTMFATCLPLHTVLRIWDSLILDGNEILIRVGFAVWSKLGEKVGQSKCADEFYSIMAQSMQGAATGDLIDDDELIKMTYKVASFPFPHLHQLREKYTYNITPFMTSSSADEYSSDHGDKKKGKSRKKNNYSIQHDDDSGDDPFYCFSGLVTNPAPPHLQVGNKALQYHNSSGNRQSLELAASPERNVQNDNMKKQNNAMAERMSTDISALTRQYLAIRTKQSQAHLICARPATSPVKPKQGGGKEKAVFPLSPAAGGPAVDMPVMINHLLIGKDPDYMKSISNTNTYVKKKRKHKSKHNHEQEIM